MTLRDAVEQATFRIERRDAETLLLHVIRRDRAFLLAHPDAVLSGSEADRLLRLVERRHKREPLQYLTEQQEFFGLT
ncbi:MAG: peptide chain release factor N(5)-glutamine methyltransferase, partial [Rhodospirillales bacterium]|nr:peptide chain release factor N(5)-glutamine methyltransferase [Acetobacter sp.]